MKALEKVYAFLSQNPVKDTLRFGPEQINALYSKCYNDEPVKEDKAEIQKGYRELMSKYQEFIDQFVTLKDNHSAIYHSARTIVQGVANKITAEMEGATDGIREALVKKRKYIIGKLEELAPAAAKKTQQW